MRVNEIFYSVQGEGRYTGTPAVFVRLAGCNLKCSFCDTDHNPFVEMTEEDIVEKVCSFPANHVVITGGEPTLQLTASLVDMLHGKGLFVQIETNGSHPLPQGCHIDWVTCSPKSATVVLDAIDEIKVVYWGQDVSEWERFLVTEHRLQPLDTQDDVRNQEILQMTINYILAHPIWRLSLQTHKMINVR
ncbi:MAG: radical SAM protein [Bacteroidales bacterium]|nr:radical SAM protein [Bacteroidales bacterium]